MAGILMGKASRDSVAEERQETEEAAAAEMNAMIRSKQQRPPCLSPSAPPTLTLSPCRAMGKGLDEECRR